MVSTVDATREISLQKPAGLTAEEAARLQAAVDFVRPYYAGVPLVTGQDTLEFVQQVASTLTILKSDIETRIAGLLFQLPEVDPKAAEGIETRFGHEIADLVAGIRALMRLREQTASQPELVRSKNAAQLAAAQVETLRKMLLAMAPDMRVVLVRLASRLTTLRFFAEKRIDGDLTHQFARETIDLYAPLANRLGIWQLKWELEDLAFRFLEPETYKRIARMLEEKRTEREAFLSRAMEHLSSVLAAAGIKAEVFGRPKHIYSIWAKMRNKSLDFSELYDVRACRIIVDDEKACYAALGIVHDTWAPVPSEFDDYIARPKPNGYQSLHTVVIGDDGRALEVQIRTAAMHHFAEYGVAAHWRYKEGGSAQSASQRYDEKIAWLRQLLAWKSEVVDTVVGQEESRREWVEKLRSTTLDERIYVMTPQARVIELPSGSTPIDFAYHLHSDVGHRCRGARVDGAMVPLNTPLKNGQTVEIITAKGGVAASGAAGPSRDWLSPGYAASPRTRAKIRAWFNAIEHQETVAQGRTLIEKSLQREGRTAVNLEELAHKLGFPRLEELFLAVGKEQFSLRHVEQALHFTETPRQAPPPDQVVARKSRASSVASGANSGVLVVGTTGLMTQLARCCKPAPPDPIVGFITRGKGVSIHRASCKNFIEMRIKGPERVIPTEWGSAGSETVYPVDIFVLAGDRQGLLRDISEIFLREKINVIGVSTQSTKGLARMAFTAEISSTEQLGRALSVIREVQGVQDAHRQ